MKKPEIVRGFVFPADDQSPITIEPRMDAFDDPVAGLASSAGRSFFAASSDVRNVAAAAN
jgi:hypothetical protein